MDNQNFEDMTSEQLLEEFGELDEAVRNVEYKLKKMQSERAELEKYLAPILEKLDDTSGAVMRSKNYIVKIKRKGYESTSRSYAKLFKLALTKVNKATRNVLERALEATENTYKVSTKLIAHSFDDEITESVVSNIFSILKNIYSKIHEAFYELKKGENALMKLAGG